MASAFHRTNTTLLHPHVQITPPSSPRRPMNLPPRLQRLHADRLSILAARTTTPSVLSRLIVSKDEVTPFDEPAHIHTLYTDGSVKNGLGGYGVFLEDGYTEERFGFSGRIICCRSQAMEPLEAELLAILAALHILQTRLPCRVYIYTDSEESIMLLDIFRTSPECLQFHQHFHLLHLIVLQLEFLLVASASAIIRVHKVRAHTGVFGNEMPDSLAKLGRRLMPTSPRLCFRYVPAPSPSANNLEEATLCSKLANLQLDTTTTMSSADASGTS